MKPERIDIDSLLQSVDLVEVVGAHVALRRDGSEWRGRCPFHDERTPSFYVAPVKGFVHCFGCGAHHDAIGFLQRLLGLSFPDACRRLGGVVSDGAAPARVSARPAIKPPTDGKWIPLLPVPDDAPDLMHGEWTVPIWNPKRAASALEEGKPYTGTRFKPSRVDAYRDAEGQLLGYVLRCEFKDGKITPTITWCIGPDGAMQWCIRPFPTPRPLCGLDFLAALPDAPVLIVEGEKCQEAGRLALPMYAVVCWPGGSHGIPYVDWAPLKGRDIVLWPDADEPGRRAMVGFVNAADDITEGVVHYLQRIGVRSMRYVDPTGQPKGWDVADALADGWTPKQLATWAAHRVADIEVVRR